MKIKKLFTPRGLYSVATTEKLSTGRNIKLREESILMIIDSRTVNGKREKYERRKKSKKNLRRIS